jgi:hypothetical protein
VEVALEPAAGGECANGELGVHRALGRPDDHRSRQPVHRRRFDRAIGEGPVDSGNVDGGHAHLAGFQQH